MSSNMQWQTVPEANIKDRAAAAIVKIFKTLISSDDAKGNGNLYKCDTIEHEGKLWLVPSWIGSKAEGWQSPERIILLDTIPHQKTGGGPFGDFLALSPIPRQLFDSPIPLSPDSGYVVILSPAIRIQIPKPTH